MDGKKKIISQWKSKKCDICGEINKFTILGERTFNVPTRLNLYEFVLQDALCDVCGFVFTGKIPTSEFLNNYYRDAYTLSSDITCIKPDYNAENRLKVIREFIPLGSTMLEVGASTGEFCETLKNDGYLITGVDPLAKSGGIVEDGIFGMSVDLSKINDKFDAVISYYVLEHVTNPRVWLDDVKRYLKIGGILITEVPNYETFPLESLSPVHMLHFTPLYLSLLLQETGFKILAENDLRTSRYFGLVNVSFLEGRAESSKEKYEIGIELLKEKEKQKLELALFIEKQDAMIYFWPANAVAGQIVRMLQNKSQVNVIDNSNTKIGAFYPGFNNPVQSPEELKIKESKHRIFILCAPAWNEDIRQQIVGMGLKDFSIIDGANIS